MADPIVTTVDVNELAKQIAQQTAEQVGQAVSQAIEKFLSTTGSSTVQSEIGDVGGTEAHERSLNNETGLLFANVKRTYDEFQHESLESVRRNRSYVDKVLADAGQYDSARQNIANQALQNAVETANMVGKQAVRHSDIAIDREWNIDEVSDLSAKSGVQADTVQAISAAVTAAVLAELKSQGVAK